MSVRLMGPFDPIFAGELVALGAGLFDREGLKVDVRPSEAGDDVIRLVADGTGTIGIVGVEKFLLARAQGAPMRPATSRVVFYALSQSGIRTPAEFISKRIGYQPGQETSITYEAMMARLS
jgi:ABC-type nitrate/sulfonate/bicarbonate transport system substrate-binding protein